MVSKHTIHSVNVTASMAASHLMVSVSFIVFKPCSVSVFTEDAYTTQDRVCEHPSCAILIKAGEPCLYVATINPGQAGRNVCAACYARYENKRATSRRPITAASASSRHTTPDPCIIQQLVNAQRTTPNPRIIQQLVNVQRTTPDPRIIQQSVNAAQRRSSINPPPVVAVSNWTNASMGPPPMSHCPHRTSGPDVNIPTSWGSRGPWAKAAYSTPIAIADTISLEISAIHEAGGRKKKNICEGKKDIDARMDAPGLMRLALDMVLPKLHTIADLFAWCDKEFTVQDSAWVGPLNSPTIGTILPLAVHAASTRNQTSDLQDKAVPTHGGCPRESVAGNLNFGRRNLKRANQLSQLSANIVSSQVSATRDSTTVTSQLSTTMSAPVPRVSVAGGSVTATPQLSTTILSAPVPRVSTVISIKQTHERAISSTSSTTSPPQKSSIPPTPQLCSPNRDQLKQVLKIGGGTDLNIKQVGKLQNENICFYSIPTRPLSDLLEHANYHSFSINTADSSAGFKTAHKGWLTLMLPPSSGLGSETLQDIVVKCPFYRVHPPGVSATSTDFRIGCFALIDEMPKLFREANVLYWAKALLGLVYDFIERAVASTSESPPFNIPHHVQYVKTSGLAFISDYQGNTELLTDPQIMTDPSVSDGDDIFGEGNISEAVSEFEKGHICNNFCKWPGFALEAFGA
ncbi:uncharacterized protein EDB93DRAFT_1251643 [Suillus bovinus]|uniref:uncharacterized protein n=1 Tax=Suillus bovinus TaxID=48563 RepID=UPI001B87263C|nr:uncharacterized protein EDB93DRAFT_1251643 [Suillus bovinus]KAG2144402.1 hypothetical protein EDB93DRAFT_1251643 [Suillus bovinus]